MRLPRPLDRLCDAALSLLYPAECSACRAALVDARADFPACARCWEETRLFTRTDALCRKRGAPAEAAPAGGRGEPPRCGLCDAEDFTAARACGVYEGALRASVLSLKREPHLGARAASLLGEAGARRPLDWATRVVPVPLHPARERERGFNQAALLARAVASRSRLPLDEWSLARAAGAARHRAGMDARGRRESVEGVFEVTRPRLVRGERVLLVDDVFTTGATVSACARVLRAAGAEEVYVLTLARALPRAARSAP